MTLTKIEFVKKICLTNIFLCFGIQKHQDTFDRSTFVFAEKVDYRPWKVGQPALFSFKR